MLMITEHRKILAVGKVECFLLASRQSKRLIALLFQKQHRKLLSFFAGY